jgi:hypothetical protein
MKDEKIRYRKSNIGITYVLLILVSCHGVKKETTQPKKIDEKQDVQELLARWEQLVKNNAEFFVPVKEKNTISCKKYRFKKKEENKRLVFARKLTEQECKQSGWDFHCGEIYFYYEQTEFGFYLSGSCNDSLSGDANWKETLEIGGGIGIKGQGCGGCSIGFHVKKILETEIIFDKETWYLHKAACLRGIEKNKNTSFLLVNNCILTY